MSQQKLVERRKLITIMLCFIIHLIWCILIYIYQVFTIYLYQDVKRPYILNILFTNAEGIRKGTHIHYRGVNIGKVISVNLYTNYVVVSTYIKSSSIFIPLNAYVKTYKTIFMADTILHIYNQKIGQLSILENNIKLQQKVNIFNHYKVIDTKMNFCYHNDFIYGFQGATLDNLVDILVRLSISLDDKDTINMLNNLIENFLQIFIIMRNTFLIGL